MLAGRQDRTRRLEPALYRIFADPFNTAGLVIDPRMHGGFLFEVHDLQQNTRVLFDCPAELHDLLLLIGSPARYVIKRVISKTLGEVAAVTSAQRLSLMAGRYVGKDDPVMIVRCQSGLPAVSEALEPFAFPHTVAGCMRGSHHAPLMPVSLTSAHPARFDGPYAPTSRPGTSPCCWSSSRPSGSATPGAAASSATGT